MGHLRQRASSPYLASGSCRHHVSQAVPRCGRNSGPHEWKAERTGRRLRYRHESAEDALAVAMAMIAEQTAESWHARHGARDGLDP